MSTVGTDRAIDYRMCEPCLRKAEAEIGPLSRKARKENIKALPVLFWGDVKMVTERVGCWKTLEAILDIRSTTLRMLLKVNSRSLHRRVPGWVARRLYAPLWGSIGNEWKDILPTRCGLAAISVRRRKLPKAVLRASRFSWGEGFSQRQRGRTGLTGTRYRLG